MTRTTTTQQSLTDAEHDLQQFLDLAGNGLSAAADNNEHAAYRLAQAVIDDANILSEPQIRGFTVFTAISHADNTVAQQILDTATDAITV